MKIYKIFRTLARLSLLLVVFGFFQPIACGFSGPEIADIALDEGSAALLFPAAMLFLSCLLSIIPTILIARKKAADLLIVPVLIIIALILAFISAKDSFGGLIDMITYDEGAELIASAVISSLIFSLIYLITSKKEREEENLLSLIQDTNSALLTEYEKSGYEQKKVESEEFTIPQSDGTPYWSSKTIAVPSGIRKAATYIEIDGSHYGSFASSININGRKAASTLNEDSILIRFFDVKEGDEVIFDIAISGPPASSFLKGSVSVAFLSKKE